MKLKRDYRVTRASLAHVRPENWPWAVTEGAWHAYTTCPKTQSATLLRRLTPGQIAFAAIGDLLAEVDNGGIHQYFRNSAGDSVQEALKGLKLVGATEHARLLLRVVRLFPNPRVLRSRRCRQKILRKIETEHTERLFDNPFDRLQARKRTRLETLLSVYLGKHLEEFFLPAGELEEQIPLPRAGDRDYRVSPKKVANLRGEKLHWALIQSLWDDYWEPLKRGREEILDFLPALSKGQRALIAIDILHKTVLCLSGLRHFMGMQIGADVLACEISAGYQLLGARMYSAFFERVLVAAGDLLPLNRMLTDQSRRLDQARKGGDQAMLQRARQTYMKTYERKRKKEAAVSAELEALTTEVKAMLESTDRRIEPFIEAYFDANRQEFVR